MTHHNSHAILMNLYTCCFNCSVWKGSRSQKAWILESETWGDMENEFLSSAHCDENTCSSNSRSRKSWWCLISENFIYF